MRQHTASQILVMRAKIILLNAGGTGIRQIARTLHISRNMVRKWLRRWDKIGDKEDVVGHLGDAPRSGTPATFTPENICSIVAIACERPEDSEILFTHWTQQGIADEAVKRGIVGRISQRSVGRFLKEADLQPHRVEMWLIPKQDERFEEKKQDICDTYKQADDLEKKR
ncbi:MAG: helix-turn-helix domain-containing protein [Magnetococcus sp. YQC-5]